MTTPVVVRPATVGDLGAVLGLVGQMEGHDDTPRRPGAPAAFAEAVARSDVRAVVAEAGGEVVGYAEVHARPSLLHGCREAWLAALAVASNRRGGGVGRRLVDVVRAEAAMLGCDEVVLESSSWRDGAHWFYETLGFQEQSPAHRFRLPVPAGKAPGGTDGDLTARFLEVAAVAATAVAGAIGGLADREPVGTGADGGPTEAADRAAEEVAVHHLSRLGVPIVSEESGLVGEAAPAAGQPWISLDPLDGSRNLRCGLPPYATSMGLVRDGRPLAGLVCDLSSGRRWWATQAGGAFVDGRPARARRRPVAIVPSPGPGGAVEVVDGYDRVRVSGSTTVDLCRVADGSAGAFVDTARGVVHVHDLAGPLAVLQQAGAVVLGPDGRTPVLVPDPKVTYRVVAAATSDEAATLHPLLRRP